MRILTLTVLLLYATLGCNAQFYDSTILPAASAQEQYVPLLQNKRIAIVINQTSEFKGVSLLDILLSRGVSVKRIFVPEHGFRGKADAGAHIANSIDSATGIPVVSLYGNNKKPATKYLDDIDVLVYDLQDVGARFYTYISTLEYCMEACATANIQMIVLDRPNPNGFYVDGPVLNPVNRSFVGMQPIPVVYGMTAGEYGLMLKGEEWVKGASNLQFRVIKCLNYSHEKKYRLPVAPSPNLRTMEAVYAYPSLCLFEGTKVSVGRGTKMPFHQFGCPEFEGQFDYMFTPVSSAGATNPPYRNKTCYGELVAPEGPIILSEINKQLQLKWIIKAWNCYPNKNDFFNLFFTKLAGTNELQKQIENKLSEKEIRKTWKDGLDAFKLIRKKYLLYPDFE